MAHFTSDGGNPNASGLMARALRGPKWRCDPDYVLRLASLRDLHTSPIMPVEWSYIYYSRRGCWNIVHSVTVRFLSVRHSLWMAVKFLPNL